MTKPVTPRDAASLVPLRTRGGALEVLMGRRPPKSKFIPDAFVFPGGKLDPHDFDVQPSRPMAPEVEEVVRATKRCTPARARALANAVIRETFEETGLMLAKPGSQTGDIDKAWTPFTSKGLAPDHSPLHCLARAITPPNSPMRFHARFFATLDAEWKGTLTPTTELLDVAWRPIREAQQLPIIDVTEWVLQAAEAQIMKGSTRDLGSQHQIPLLSYQNNVLKVRY